MDIGNQVPMDILLVTRAITVRTLDCQLKWEIPVDTEQHMIERVLQLLVAGQPRRFG